MSKKDEIHKEIWNIWQLQLEVKHCFEYSYYLYKPETKEEEIYLKTTQDFQYIRLILWKMAVIELAKLFKDNDRFSIIRFINKLKFGAHYGDLGIKPEVINNWEKSIEKNKSSIETIIKLRDKLYAHTDAEKEKYMHESISFEQTKKLIEIVESIIIEIYSVVFDSYADLSSPIFERDRFNIIKVLSKAHEDRLKDFEQYFTERKNKIS